MTEVSFPLPIYITQSFLIQRCTWNHSSTN